MRRIFKALAIALLSISSPGALTAALAAACCGGSAATPALISTDDMAQLTLTASRGAVIGNASSGAVPVFRASNVSEVTETYRIDGAILISDRFQTGLSVPIVRRSLSYPGMNSSASALGDIRLNVGYEALPEWSYSEWKPRGFVFVQATLPTGQSAYESVSNLNIFGQGFYSFSVGTLLVKQWSKWDAYLIPELHTSLARTFPDLAEGGQETQTVKSGIGGSLAVGAGMSPGGGNLRVGIRIQPIYNQSKTVIMNAGTKPTSEQLVWDTALEAGYMLSKAWSISGSYTDETLIGPVIGDMNRIFALGLQHRWER